MPEILDQSEIQLQFSDIWSRVRHPYPALHPRSPGVHLSAILKALALDSGLLRKPKYKTAEFDQYEEDMPLCMAVGMALEEYLVGLYPGMIWQPGELCLDSVYGTPDGTTVLDSDPYLRVEEFKGTWKSERTHPIEKEWMWLKQISGYCKMIDTTMAQLHVVWMCGSYYPPQPKYMRYLLRYSQRELDKDWAMIERNKDRKDVICEG